MSARTLGRIIVLLAAGVSPAQAQLRPVHPLDWKSFDSDVTLLAGAGFGLLRDQHASLAGTRGTLYEFGNINIAWRAGHRVVLEVAGTARRGFDDQDTVRDEWPGVDPPTGRRRHDAGDVRVSTIVALSNPDARASVALRFGTRLPTTSDENGLERDRTDFYATLGGRYQYGRLSFSGESGVAINGTRLDSPWDQLDVLMYSFGIDYDAGFLAPSLVIVGHDDLHGWELRGNEDLSEVRFGVRAGDRFWAEALAVKGITTFSPSHGLLLTIGIQR